MATAPGRAERRDVTRFQLVFRKAEGEWSEIRDSNAQREPHIDGELIVDGKTYLIRGVEWLLRREDLDERTPRFVCTLVTEPVRVDRAEDGRRSADFVRG